MAFRYVLSASLRVPAGYQAYSRTTGLNPVDSMMLATDSEDRNSMSSRAASGFSALSMMLSLIHI